MTSAKPATKFDDLFESALELLERDSVNEFDIKKLERDATTIKSASLTGCFELMGVAHALRREPDAVVAKFDRAIQLGGGLASAMRLVSVLERLNETDLLMDVVNRFQSAIRENPEAADYMHDVLGRLGYLSKAHALADDMRRMNIELDSPSAALLSEIFERHHVTEEEVRAPIQFVRSYLFERGIRIVNARSSLPLNEGADIPVFYEFIINGSPAQVAEMENEVFERLAEKQFPAEVGGVVTLSLAVDQ